MKRRQFIKTTAHAGAAGFVLPGFLSSRSNMVKEKPKVTPDPLFLQGKALRVKPILLYNESTPLKKASWREFGDIRSQEDAVKEARRIDRELKHLQEMAEFPFEILPIKIIDTQDKLKQVPVKDADLCVLYAAGHISIWPHDVPMVMFLRHRVGPYYVGYIRAHFRFLRGSGDEFVHENFNTDDVVVDYYEELLWRLRAMYGLKNAMGTKMLAIGGLAAYEEVAQEAGPRVAKDAWGYEFITVTNEEFTKRLNSARADQKTVNQINKQTDDLINKFNVKLETKRKFVFNSYMALHVVKQYLKETGATNFGFSHCMAHEQISMLDTPPCFVLSLANDEGYTAYCHTDLSHTMPGVLMRWIASRPTFVSNAHFTHHGLIFYSHCQAPRRMNGRDFEPGIIKTHYESDYGAACKTEYTEGQTVTVVQPNLRCTRWQGFRGKIVGVPTYPSCRSQLEIEIDGDWEKFLREMEGFHGQIIYGDYLKEIGFAMRKLGSPIEWQCYSQV